MKSWGRIGVGRTRSGMVKKERSSAKEKRKALRKNRDDFKGLRILKQVKQQKNYSAQERTAKFLFSLKKIKRPRQLQDSDSSAKGVAEEIADVRDKRAERHKHKRQDEN